MGTFATLRRMLDAGPVAALVTVVATKGSTPRETGTRLVVRADGAFSGTIGGGRFEWEALAEARALIGEGRDTFRLHRFALGPELGQCCGGVMTVSLETFTTARIDEVTRLAASEDAGGLVTEAETRDAGAGLQRRVVGSTSAMQAGSMARTASAPHRAAVTRADARLHPDGRLVEAFGERRRPLALFGAGHVGRALVVALAPLQTFQVTWVDSRDDAFPRLVPGEVETVRTDDPAAVLERIPAGAFVVIMTHDHALDLAILTAALDARRFPYIGLIGSDTKRARFISRMKSAGLDADIADHFVCPIGLAGITSKVPAVIAASVAAQLLAEDERVAAVEAGDQSHGERVA